jgi:hypothetical protein
MENTSVAETERFWSSGEKAAEKDVLRHIDVRWATCCGPQGA